MELKRGETIANEVIKRLAPYCEKIQVAGSIRRKKPLVRDIDIVLIPSDPWNLETEILAMARPFAPKLNGKKLKRFQYEGGAQVDLYFATEEIWATLLLIRTGPTEQNIRLCSLAKKKGWHLAADGTGLFDADGKRIAGDSEASIFNALGFDYITPEQRK